MNKAEKVKVVFQPSGRRGEVKKGTNVLEASRQIGVDIETLCGEKRICGKCKIRVEEGSLNISPWKTAEEKFITEDEKEEGYRLGCCAELHGDALIYVPVESRAGKQIVSKAARDIPIEHDPAVRIYTVSLTPPTIDEPTADFERLCKVLDSQFGLKGLVIDLYALRDLPNALRKGDWEVTVSVWMDKEIIRIRSGKVERHYGMAIDIGTTTVAGYLCNLETMKVIDTQTLMNPQCKYGEDVMSRISYSNTNVSGMEKMSNDIVEALNSIIRATIQSSNPLEEDTGQGGNRAFYDEESKDASWNDREYLGLREDDIEDLTIVGNTIMHHILLKLNPEHVGMAPFPPVIHHSLDIKARDLGLLINRGAYVHVLPNEAGFVGADNVGVLITEEPYKSEEIQLIIDIGTNGELLLGNRERLLSSSCATGPALEGAQLSFGMRAAPGAIERIRIDPETHEVDYKVIGREAWKSYSRPEEMKAKGICGSGILDVLAELYRAGIVLKSGQFNKEQKSERYRRSPDNDQAEFVIAWKEETSINRDIVISQNDIRQIQLAKGALYSGCRIMMERLGLKKVDKVKIAGAFGTHVDREKALIMGLFPDIELERISSIGNAAGDGARIVLLNRDKRQEADLVARKVEYLELTVEKDFQRHFMEALHIPHMKDPFPNLEGLVPDHILHQK